MTDPTDDPRIRLQAVADQFSAALADAFKLGMRQAIAKQIAADYGPGPWVLHEDGRIEPYIRVAPRKKRPTT